MQSRSNFAIALLAAAVLAGSAGRSFAADCQAAPYGFSPKVSAFPLPPPDLHDYDVIGSGIACVRSPCPSLIAIDLRTGEQSIITGTSFEAFPDRGIGIDTPLLGGRAPDSAWLRVAWRRLAESPHTLWRGELVETEYDSPDGKFLELKVRALLIGHLRLAPNPSPCSDANCAKWRLSLPPRSGETVWVNVTEIALDPSEQRLHYLDPEQLNAEIEPGACVWGIIDSAAPTTLTLLRTR